jgi:hypothetical protein
MTLPYSHPDWEKIAFDVARNQCGARAPVEDLLVDMGLTPLEFETLCDDSLFKRKVREFTKELTENGSSFALKAQIQAEDLLKTQYRIAKDPDTPPAVAITAISNTVRWAGLDRKASDAVGEAGASGPKISISIKLNSSSAETTTITASVSSTEDEPEDAQEVEVVEVVPEKPAIEYAVPTPVAPFLDETPDISELSQLMRD